MKLEDEQLLSLVAQTMEQKYLRIETIRQLAGTEEKYRMIIREAERVKAQLLRARAIGVAATLNMVEWFIILERFDWKCAYCRVKPFQVMSQRVPQAEGGTTPNNCIPACHSCLVKRRTNTHRLKQALFWPEIEDHCFINRMTEEEASLKNPPDIVG